MMALEPDIFGHCSARPGRAPESDTPDWFGLASRELFSRERPREGIRRTMAIICHHLAVVFLCFCTVSQFLVGLRLEHEDERIFLVRLLQVIDGGFVVAAIVGNITC